MISMATRLLRVMEVSGLGLHHRGEGRHGFYQTRDVSEDGAGLITARGEHGDRGLFTGCEIGVIGFEAGEVDRNRCQDPALTTTATDDERSLGEG